MTRGEATSILVVALLLFVLAAGVLLDLWPLGTTLSYSPYFLVTGAISIAIWGFRARLEASLGGKPAAIPRSEIHANSTTKQLERETTKIRKDEYVFYKIKLNTGSQVTGFIKSEGLFDVYLFTESSFRSFDAGGNAKELYGTEGVTSYKPSFKIERLGTYFIVIQNSDNRNIMVDVELNEE